LHFGLDHAARRIYFLLPVGVYHFFRVPIDLLMMFSAIDQLGLSDGGYFCVPCAQPVFVRLDRQPYVCGPLANFPDLDNRTFSLLLSYLCLRETWKRILFA